MSRDGRKLFFDAHMHLLTLRHPSYFAGIRNFSLRPGEMILDQLLSPSYLVGSLNSRGRYRLENLLSALDRDVYSQICLLEDDLAGRYGSAPFVKDGMFSFLGRVFSGYVLMPLVMDFSQQRMTIDRIAYSSPDPKPVEGHMEEILAAICKYRMTRPAGLFEIFPLLGLNLARHGRSSLLATLERWFPSSGRRKGLEARERTFSSLKAPLGSKKRSLGLVIGIKLYPPAGFDPWPADPIERAKAELLYGFCEERRVPIVTHCDDQGFRTVPVAEARRMTDPATWEPVLRAFPRLRLDFAHFGKRYSGRLGNGEIAEWTDAIERYMSEYEHVYADVAFDGVDPRFYRSLGNRVAANPGGEIGRKTIFGSDFPMSLLLIDSYSAYLRRFEQSALGESLKIAMCTENPFRFFFPD